MADTERVPSAEIGRRLRRVNAKRDHAEQMAEHWVTRLRLGVNALTRWQRRLAYYEKELALLRAGVTRKRTRKARPARGVQLDG